MSRSRLLVTCATLLLALVAIWSSPALAAGGDLDDNFDGDGKLTTPFAGFAYASGGVVAAPGKKLVAAGFYQVGSGNDDFAVTRYLSDGTLDDTFDMDGRATMTLSGGDDAAGDVAVQGDGKIVVAGYSGDDFAVARFTTSGEPDDTFGSDGWTTTDFGGNDYGQAVAIQGNGKIVVAGYTSVGHDMAVVRYSSAGVPDSNFDGDGKVTIDIQDSVTRAWDVAIDGDGNVVLAGDANGGSGLALARVTPSGAPDSSLGGDGKLVTDLGSSTESANGVAIQGDGRILTAGYTYTSAARTFDFALVRYTTAGELDGTFSGDGIQRSDFAAAEHGFAVTVQPDGKIVVAGDSGSVSVDYRFALARYRSGGRLDDKFGGDGRVITDLGTTWDSAYGVTLFGRRHKIVAAGRSAGSFGLARYLVA